MVQNMHLKNSQFKNINSMKNEMLDLTTEAGIFLRFQLFLLKIFKDYVLFLTKASLVQFD